MHHDAGAIGGIFIRDVWKRRLNTLKEIGVNAIRMSHNPADPSLLTLCDEMGFVVINEALDEWRRNKDKWITSRFAKDMRPELETGYGDIYEEWAERDAEGIRKANFWMHTPGGIGECFVVPLYGGGGDELENVNRWRAEVDLPPLLNTEAIQSIRRMKKFDSG